MSLIKEVAEIIGEVYQVGGSVRDEIMGRTPKDYDFTTPLTPDEMEEKIRAQGLRCYTIGKRFGTVGFKLNGQMIEVTTFREETYTAGSRKPEVTFVRDIETDLSRRDFTMNAIARTVDGGLIDPFNGIEDIDAKIIRAVGDAYERFLEDPLRLLRACRFSSQFGFFVCDDTDEMMGWHAPKILTVSKERWIQEMDKLLLGESFDYGFYQLESSGLARLMFHEAFGYDQVIYRDRLRHSNAIVDAVTLDEKWLRLLEPSSRASAWAHAEFRKDQMRKLCNHLKFSKERTRYLVDNV